QSDADDKPFRTSWGFDNGDPPLSSEGIADVSGTTRGLRSIRLLWETDRPRGAQRRRRGAGLGRSDCQGEHAGYPTTSFLSVFRNPMADWLDRSARDRSDGAGDPSQAAE